MIGAMTTYYLQLAMIEWLAGSAAKVQSRHWCRIRFEPLRFVDCDVNVNGPHQMQAAVKNRGYSRWTRIGDRNRFEVTMIKTE